MQASHTIAALGLLPLGDAIAVGGFGSGLGRWLGSAVCVRLHGRGARTGAWRVQEEGGRGNGDSLGHLRRSRGVQRALASVKRRRGGCWRVCWREELADGCCGGMCAVAGGCTGSLVRLYAGCPSCVEGRVECSCLAHAPPCQWSRLAQADNGAHKSTVRGVQGSPAYQSGPMVTSTVNCCPRTARFDLTLP
jgi:hypothetical protein